MAIKNNVQSGSLQVKQTSTTPSCMADLIHPRIQPILELPLNNPPESTNNEWVIIEEIRFVPSH